MIVPDPTDLPAIAGGRPMFPGGLPLARPRVASPDAVARDVKSILTDGALTNGPFVRRLEEQAATYLGVRHCVAVASCTTGLMLLLRAAELGGEVVMPSFTFAASAHAVDWNGLQPVFTDIDTHSLTLDPESVGHAIGMRTSAILATHVYGTPCDVEALTEIAHEHGLRLFFDAAHAFGSRRGGRMIGGFGDAEVFSLSPTKPLVAAEGGIIATDDDLLAERCRIGRDYGNPGDYDCRFVGLNARMSELHAATALASFGDLEERVMARGRLAAAYREALSGVRGISFPTVRAQDRSTYKDLALLVEPGAFGAPATRLADALSAEGIETRRYYEPPVHVMRAYEGRGRRAGDLPVTAWAAARALCLPLWDGMTSLQVQQVGEAVRRIQGWGGTPSG
ncbi:MAG TPA: DegT/DnrJ/EryC1/StrS family aminotransferase [Actinomycetota bacterium]|nr:DegT/DnrJ/EryC1/StrS family aminotransferase [Actinomycetota bacterium]